MTKPEAGAWLPSTTTGRTDMTAALIMGAVLFGIPAILARLFVKWGIY